MILFLARLRQLACAATAALALSTSLTASSRAEQPPIERIEISARSIARFQIGLEQKIFGPLEFVGGLEMTSPSRNLGALSAFRFLKPGSDFIGVADTGFWYFGRIVRDSAMRPTGVENFRMIQMVDGSGNGIEKKWQADAEGLAVKDGIATVGFERTHRVAQYNIDPDNMAPPFGELDFLVPRNELRINRGFETVAYSAEKGGLVLVSEKSLDTSGNIFAAVLDGPGKGVFTVKRNGEFDITDGAFLPDGDLLLLERSFSMASGVKMRLRRIASETIAKGQVADGPVLLEADMGYQIDNMEGLDVWQRSDGALMVSLVSDDNHSILQRNLYLEFILHGD